MVAFLRVVYNAFVQFYVVVSLEQKHSMTWNELVAEQLGMVPRKCRTPRPGTLHLTSWHPPVFMVYAPVQFMTMHVTADQTAIAISSMEKIILGNCGEYF